MPGRHPFKMKYQGNNSAFPFKSSPTKFGGGVVQAATRVRDRSNPSNISEGPTLGRHRRGMFSGLFQKFIDRRRRKQEHPQE